MNYNSDATGTLVLKTITPVITALFTPFGLQPMGEGTAYVRWFDHEDGFGEESQTCGSWGEVHDNLVGLAQDLGLTVPAVDEDDEGEDDFEFKVPPVFDALMTHFKVDDQQRAQVLRLIDERSDGDMDEWRGASADFGDLLQLASALNDGHDLVSIACDCATVGSRPAINAYYGTATFSGVPFVHGSNTSNELKWAENVRKALTGKQLDTATDLFASKVKNLLGGIADESARKAITKDLITALQATV